MGISFREKIRLLRSLFTLYKYDGRRYLKSSMILDTYSTQERMLGLITARQHVVEKGLTMPTPRLEFGKENLIELIKLCKIYKKKYDCTQEQYVSTISAIKEYSQFHKDRGFKLDKSIQKLIDDLVVDDNNIQIESQIQSNPSEFFKDVYCSFDAFAKSRHSIRNYSDEEVTYDELEKVVDLARTSPSACNRQPVRVHICSKEVGQKVLKYHNGNRGFGELANKLIVITCDLSSYMNVLERNCAYIDGGIFVMNLLYALHYYKLGACTLNWSAKIENDKKVRDILSLSENEVIVCLFTVGKLPPEFSIASSPRIPLDKITYFHK